MYSLFFTPLAIADIGEIWDYTEFTWSQSQAELYNQLIEGVCIALAQGVQEGQDASHVRDDYRKQLVGRHVIYFKISSTEVMVIRILHQRMDVDQHLDGDRQ